MRKTILKLTTIVMLFVLALSLVACSVIPQDYKEARSNLRDNNYEVNEGGAPIDMPISVNVLNLLSFIYTDAIREMETSATLIELEKKMQRSILALDEWREQFLFAFYFEDEAIAREYYEEIKVIFETAKKEGVKQDVSKDDLTYGVSGVVVYFGTQDALDAAK